MSDNETPGAIARFAPEEPLAEQLLHMLVALATELAATHERVDTLERMLAGAGVLEAGNADAFEPDTAAQVARQQWREQFLDRMLEHLQGDIAAARASAGDKPA
jgi:hypothetical protein